MFKNPLLLFMLILFTGFVTAQNIDSLKLNDNEIPASYKKSDKLVCITPHSYSFYTSEELYSFLGKVVKKDFQSFEKKKDTGSILYFEFEKDFAGDGFLNGLLWGEGTKPTKSEPDDYYTKGKILIIWSLPMDSPLKKISKDKVMKLLK